MRRQLSLDLNIDHDEAGIFVDRLREMLEDPDRSPEKKKGIRRLIKVVKKLHKIITRNVSSKIPISKRFQPNPPKWLEK